PASSTKRCAARASFSPRRPNGRRPMPKQRSSFTKPENRIATNEQPRPEVGAGSLRGQAVLNDSQNDAHGGGNKDHCTLNECRESCLLNDSQLTQGETERTERHEQ